MKKPPIFRGKTLHVEKARWCASIDLPKRRKNMLQEVTISGWVFEKKGAQVIKIRASLEGGCFSARHNLARPDVARAFPRHPQAASSGFEVKVSLKEKKNLVVLEALLDSTTSGESWIPFAYLTLTQAGRFRKYVSRKIMNILGYYLNTKNRLSSPSPDNYWVNWQKLSPRFKNFIEAIVEQNTRVRLHALLQHDPEPWSENLQHGSSYSGQSRFVIVTPSFNQARYLRETIQSVVSQNPRRLSYVVHDGGSQDGSVDILKEYEGKLSSWVSERDEGQADAIVKGFSRVEPEKNDIMAYINSDDIYLPGAFKTVGDYFDANPDVDVVYGNRIIIDENSLMVGRWHLPAHNDDILTMVDYVPQETMFWRRSAYLKAGGIDKSFRFAMDWDLLLKFRRAGCNIVHLPVYLAAFRIHGEQKTSTIINSVGLNEFKILRERECDRKINDQEIQEVARCMGIFSAFDEWLIHHLGTGRPPEIMNLAGRTAAPFKTYCN